MVVTKFELDGYIEDLISNLLYYDRKDDEELEMDDIENSIKNGDITVDDIVDLFREHLTSGIS